MVDIACQLPGHDSDVSAVLVKDAIAYGPKWQKRQRIGAWNTKVLPSRVPTLKMAKRIQHLGTQQKHKRQ